MGNRQTLSRSNNVLVLGCTGYIGKETVKALSEIKDLNVFAGSRNLENLKKCAFSSSVKPVKVNQSVKDDVARVVKEHSIDCVMIIPPGTERRCEVASTAIQGAKSGGVKALVVVSETCVPYTGTIFANQFMAIEEEVKKSGVPYVILRLPLFIDNILAQLDRIKESKRFIGTIDGDTLHSGVTIKDGGKIAAIVLSDPFKYEGKTYEIVSDVYTYNELAAALSKSSGSEISYERVDSAKFMSELCSLGLPEWQANGVLQLFTMIELKLDSMITKGDIKCFNTSATKITDFANEVGTKFSVENKKQEATSA